MSIARSPDSTTCKQTPQVGITLQLAQTLSIDGKLHVVHQLLSSLKEQEILKIFSALVQNFSPEHQTGIVSTLLPTLPSERQKAFTAEWIQKQTQDVKKELIRHLLAEMQLPTNDNIVAILSASPSDQELYIHAMTTVRPKNQIVVAAERVGPIVSGALVAILGLQFRTMPKKIALAALVPAALSVGMYTILGPERTHALIHTAIKKITTSAETDEPETVEQQETDVQTTVEKETPTEPSFFQKRRGLICEGIFAVATLATLVAGLRALANRGDVVKKAAPVELAAATGSGKWFFQR